MKDAAPPAGARTKHRAVRPDEMPRDFSVSLDALRQGGTDAFLSRRPEHAASQDMEGFDPDYVNFVDYVVRITHRIWEEKDVGHVYDTYSHDCVVWDDFGLTMGRDKVVEHTVAGLSAFPDMRILADEVIWAGTAATGLHSSHRARITGTNTGYSRFAPPTGRSVDIWSMANCVARGGEIFEEHLVYDHAHLLTQLGLDPMETARRLVREGAGPKLPRDFLAAEPARRAGQNKPAARAVPEVGDDPSAFARAALHMIWNRRSFAVMDRVYHPSVRVQASGGRVFDGVGPLRSYALSLVAAIPDAVHSVNDLYWMGNPEEGFLVAVRWSLRGSHRGWGRYGPPTGRALDLWGLTHWVIEGGRIAREWTMFNEFGVLMQIAEAEAAGAPTSGPLRTERGVEAHGGPAEGID